jgi:transcriptional regulator with XRE-family HTH domain
MAAFPGLLRADRERRGFTIGQVAWRLGVKPQEYRGLEAGTRSPDFETWDRICTLYGWPQTFEGLRTVCHQQARCAGVAPPEQSHGHQRQHQGHDDEEQDVREVSVQS